MHDTHDCSDFAAVKSQCIAVEQAPIEPQFNRPFLFVMFRIQ